MVEQQAAIVAGVDELTQEIERLRTELARQKARADAAEACGGRLWERLRSSPLSAEVPTDEAKSCQCNSCTEVPQAAEEPPSIGQLAAHFKEHGWVLTPEFLPDRICNEIKREALEAARRRCDFPDRTSINDQNNISKDSWWNWIEWAITKDSPVSQLLEALYGDCWFFDVAGGDVVAPGAIFRFRQCRPHSDWNGVRSGVVCVSAFVHDDTTTARAPMVLYSLKTGASCKCTGPKGTLLLRDVDVIHHGTANDTDQARVLPTLRFVLADGLRGGYYPTPYVPPSVWRTFDERTKTKLILALQDDDDEADEDAAPGTRFKTPGTMDLHMDVQ